MDNGLFNDLYAMLGQQPGAAPRENDSRFTNEKQFIGSAYFLDRSKLNPDYDYRFLGDAAFDTRYISNAMLSQTGKRYINGVGSELAQMKQLIDNAARAQSGLNLQFGIGLTPHRWHSWTQHRLVGEGDGQWPDGAGTKTVLGQRRRRTAQRQRDCRQQR